MFIKKKIIKKCFVTFNLPVSAAMDGLFFNAVAAGAWFLVFGIGGAGRVTIGTEAGSGLSAKLEAFTTEAATCAGSVFIDNVSGRGGGGGRR